MSRQCAITKKKPMVGNNVSHSNRKTKRRFDINLQDTSLYSEILGRYIKMRATSAGLRTVDHKGGLDAYLLGTAPTKLDPSLRKVRVQLKAKQLRAA